MYKGVDETGEETVINYRKVKFRKIRRFFNDLFSEGE